ncbi:MAG: prepilin-type N-terminal cleavage/methylation domain-containing protein [Nitrospirae bacterium]|nr:prepilin-type N-terminal cleavage/methylation domain-containing protein [Nitrospirota bacterium]
MKKSILYKSNGFTLIELMIVVVILGILATLATGSFLSYQAKSKQAEAKSNISSIAESALAYKAEYGTFVTDWSGIGWQANGTTRYRYWYNGLAAAGTPTNAEAGVDYSDPGSTATVNTIIVGSVGNIDRDASTDQWLYNQDRVFTNLQNDVSTP